MYAIRNTYLNCGHLKAIDHRLESSLEFRGRGGVSELRLGLSPRPRVEVDLRPISRVAETPLPHHVYVARSEGSRMGERPDNPQ